MESVFSLAREKMEKTIRRKYIKYIVISADLIREMNAIKTENW